MARVRNKPAAGSLGRPEDQLVFDEYALRDFVRFTGGKRVLDHFRDMDADGSGELTKKEFGKSVKAMGFVHATKAAIDAAFDALDTDHSGKLDYSERECSARSKCGQVHTHCTLHSVLHSLVAACRNL